MKEIKSIELERLLLDKKNPRIHQEISTKITQVNLAKFLYIEFGIDDLKDSILKNGYFQVEPMVAIPDEEDETKFVVVEGNRRLTTIKILCDESYRNSIISTGKREDFIANEKLRKQLERIPVVIADKRDNVHAYLGVRHLGGVVKWEPLAQSKYVYSYIIVQKNNDQTILVKNVIDTFVEQTNNKRVDVINHFYKYCIYENIKRIIEDDISIKTNIEDKFSLLEVAFGKTGTTSIAKYIGIDSYSRLDPEDYENIIPYDKENEVKNLIRWVFTENSIIKESRQINEYLKPILRNETSTKALEQGEDKETALLLSDSFDNIIKKSCTAVHKSLTHIQQNWSSTKPESREALKEFYIANVKEKVKKTDISLDIT